MIIYRERHELPRKNFSDSKLKMAVNVSSHKIKKKTTLLNFAWSGTRPNVELDFCRNLRSEKFYAYLQYEDFNF